MQALDVSEIPRSAARKSLHPLETTSGSASVKSTIARSKTSPFLPSSERLKAQLSRYLSHSPSLASPRFARPAVSQAVNTQSSPSQTEMAESMTQEKDASISKKTSEHISFAKRSTRDAAIRMRAERNIRNIFHRRDLTTMTKPDKTRESKRASANENALAQRVKDSTKVSKTCLPRPLNASSAPSLDPIETLYSLEKPHMEYQPQSVPSALDSDSKMLPSKPAAFAQYDTAIVVHKILDRVMSMEDSSPDCLQGLEIAEVCVATHVRFVLPSS